MEIKEKDLKTIHECEYYIGRISDVTVRSSDGVLSIHCRRCGGKLDESQVNNKMLRLIKKKEQDRRKRRK